jgi:SPP1 family predicted phage head-tail adaptor
MSINFGKYDQLINIESYTETRNSSGDAIRSYSTLYSSIWAKVIPAGGVESNQADEKVASIVIDVEVRATGLTLNETMRIVWRSKTFNIDSIDEFGTRLNEGYKIRAIAKDND